MERVRCFFLPLTASGLYLEPNSLRKSAYIGWDSSDAIALWKSGLLPFSTWQRVNYTWHGREGKEEEGKT